MKPTTEEMRAFERQIELSRQIKDIQRILSNDRLHTCACGLQGMPLKTVNGLFTCPECGRENEL